MHIASAAPYGRNIMCTLQFMVNHGTHCHNLHSVMRCEPCLNCRLQHRLDHCYILFCCIRVRLTAGPTKDAITEALAAVGKNERRDAKTSDLDNAVAVAWVENQMAKPATGLRAYFRRRSNPRAYYDVSSGSATPPCKVGSRWHKFAFDKGDVGKVLEVDSISSLQLFRLTVDGVNRGETPKLFGEKWPGLQETTIQHSGDGRCMVPASTAHNAEIRVEDCDPSTPSANTLWTWSAETKLIKHRETGAFLKNAGGPNSILLCNSNVCDIADRKMWWDYDPSSNRIRLLHPLNEGTPSKCIDLVAGDDRVNIASCSEAASNQQWSMSATKPSAPATPPPTTSFAICAVSEGIGQAPGGRTRW